MLIICQIKREKTLRKFPHAYTLSAFRSRSMFVWNTYYMAISPPTGADIPTRHVNCQSVPFYMLIYSFAMQIPRSLSMTKSTSLASQLDIPSSWVRGSTHLPPKDVGPGPCSVRVGNPYLKPHVPSKYARAGRIVIQVGDKSTRQIAH